MLKAFMDRHAHIRIRRPLHALVVRGVDNIVGEVDKELRETTLRGCVVPENRGEGGIPQWFW